MILWVMELEATESLPALTSKVTAQMPTAGKPKACVNPGPQYHLGHNMAALAKCKQPNEAMVLICKTLQYRIGAVPPFKQFMRGKRQRDA